MIRTEAYRSGIPQSLKELNCWVLWKLEARNGKQSKIPYSVTGRRASSTDPGTWCSFREAISVLARQDELYSGLGFVFSADNDIIGVDVDHCLVDGVMTDEAAEIVSLFPDTYYELSQSGAGLHIICRGSVPQSFRRGAVECYQSKRFFALTGNAIQACDVADGQAGLDWMWERYGKKDKPAGETARTAAHRVSYGTCGGMSDADIVERIRQRDKRGARLLAGDWQGAGYGSPSEADSALCTVLAFWCNRDVGQMERIFSTSGLGQRRKWTGRADYRQRTIAAGCAACGETITEWKEVRNRERKEKLFEAW